MPKNNWKNIEVPKAELDAASSILDAIIDEKPVSPAALAGGIGVINMVQDAIDTQQNTTITSSHDKE